MKHHPAGCCQPSQHAMQPLNILSARQPAVCSHHTTLTYLAMGLHSKAAADIERQQLILSADACDGSASGHPCSRGSSKPESSACSSALQVQDRQHAVSQLHLKIPSRLTCPPPLPCAPECSHTTTPALGHTSALLPRFQALSTKLQRQQ
jgi:hypothetical protein